MPHSQDILINWTPQETRVAIIESGAVQELHVERTLERGLVGNVYTGKVVRVLPEGVYLTYLKQSGTRFEIRGVAQSSTRVSAFMRNIDASEWLADPALRIVETKGRDAGGAEFTLFANQRARVPPEEAAKGETVAAK